MTSPLSMFPRDPQDAWGNPIRPPEFEDKPPEIKVGNRIRYKGDARFHSTGLLGVVKSVYWSVSKRWCVTFLYEHVYYDKETGQRLDPGGGHEYASEVEVDILDRLANEA